jgi:hypothetical protein
LAFDRKGKLWKLWQWGYAWSDDAKRFTDMNHGRSAVHWRNVDTVDIQNGRGNLWREYGGGLPDFSIDFITKLYDLNRFTEIAPVGHTSDGTSSLTVFNGTGRNICKNLEPRNF